MKLNDLNINSLYILSVKNNNPGLFTKLIYKFTSSLKTTKPIVVHTGLMMYYLNRWYICEVGHTGEHRRFFQFDKTKDFYIAKVDKITVEGKEYIYNKYNKTPLKSELAKILCSISSFLFNYPYPLWTATASLEVSKFNIFGRIYNYITDLYRDLLVFIRTSIFRQKSIPFCSQSMLKTILEIINEFKMIRMRNQKQPIKLPIKLWDLIIKEQCKLNEIYPQQIMEAIDHSLLVE